jgi:uncharacterized protein YcbX
MERSRITVRSLSVAPVKGLRVSERSEVHLGREGVAGDRRFYLVDRRGWMVNGKRFGALQQVQAELEQDPERLALRFPGGEVLNAEIERGEQLGTRFFSQPRDAVAIRGPFSDALSAHVGEPLRLVEAADGSSAVDRGQDGAVSLVSRASVGALARLASSGEMDVRRFRMSIEIDGVDAFEEDAWVGREVAVGEALIALVGHVGRCVVTSMGPETGEVDEPTLDHLRELRGGAPTSEPLAMGVHGEVRRSGRVRVGDLVRPA